MVVQLNIEYDQLVELVKQLPQAQRQDLIAQLLTTQERPLTAEEKIQLLMQRKSIAQ